MGRPAMAVALGIERRRCVLLMHGEQESEGRRTKIDEDMLSDDARQIVRTDRAWAGAGGARGR